MIKQLLYPLANRLYHRAQFELTLLENNLRDPAIILCAEDQPIIGARYRRWMRIYRFPKLWTRKTYRPLP